MNHFIRDTDIAYKYIYKQWLMPIINKIYSAKNEKNVLRKTPIAQRQRAKTYSVCTPNGANVSDIAIEAFDEDDDDEQQPINSPISLIEEEENGIMIEMEIMDDEIIQNDAVKSLHYLAQEQSEVHFARIILHFQMLRFSEFSSRFAIILLLFVDIICDGMGIGNKSLFNESKIYQIMLVFAVSILITLIINQITQRMLAKEALTSIQFLNKIECIDEFSANDRVFIHVWIIFGDQCKIFERFWMFFAFVIGYQIVIILQAYFSTNNGLISICPIFF